MNSKSMLSSLSKIKNPLVRTITAASTAFAMTTLIAVLVIYLVSDPKDKAGRKAAFRNGIYVTLLAFLTGAGIGSYIKDVKDNSSPDQSQPQAKSDSNTWQDWREFEVVAKQPESAEITSFYFQPLDDGELPDFQPGQYLTIKLDIPEQDRPVIRSYSLSDYAQDHNYYRLSIKREGAPKDLDVPPGLASNFMHDSIAVGSTIPCKPPKGKFWLEVNNSIPAVLISNGVGITPMISMAKACAQENPSRHVWFVHGARNADYHACREEVNQIAAEYSNLHIHYCYSRPRPEDEGKYHSQGYADKQLIADQIIPVIKEYHHDAGAEYYLCGSPKFMDSLRSGLSELGVAEDDVYFESFGGGKTKGKAEAKVAGDSTVDSAEVTFAQSDLTATWTPEDGTLLEFAEAHGLEPDSSCLQGICGTCECRLMEGEVEYSEDPAGEPDEDSVLTCIAKPKTAKVVLDL